MAINIHRGSAERPTKLLPCSHHINWSSAPSGRGSHCPEVGSLEGRREPTGPFPTLRPSPLCRNLGQTAGHSKYQDGQEVARHVLGGRKQWSRKAAANQEWQRQAVPPASSVQNPALGLQRLGGASGGERAADTACNAQGCTGLYSDHFLMVQRKEVTQPLFGAPPSKVSNPVPLRIG